MLPASVVTEVSLMLLAVLGAMAGFTDWRSRRIPNWLTIPAAAVGILVNAVAIGWTGAKSSLLGLALGLGLLLPFVLIRSLGAGDWKLIGAVGAFLGPANLLNVLFAALLIAGLMALVLIIWKGRLKQTVRNIAHIVGALFSLHLPGPEVSLDSQQSLKIPFGVAAAFAVILYAGQQFWMLHWPR